jgi:hypothetical protein
MARSDKFSGIWQGISQLGQTKGRTADAWGQGIGAFGKGIGGGLSQWGQNIQRKKERDAIRDAQREKFGYYDENGVWHPGAESGVLGDKIKADIEFLKQSSPLELQSYKDKGTFDTDESIRLDEATQKPMWDKLGYPDFQSWRDDQMSGDKPDWERLGFANLEDWKEYELALRTAGKTVVGEGDDDNLMYQSYLAQLVGNNEDIFMTTNDLGEKIMNPWGQLNTTSRDRILDLWSSLIRFEDSAMQSTLMSMMETQLGAAQKMLPGEDTAPGHFQGPPITNGALPARDRTPSGRVTNKEKELLDQLTALRDIVGPAYTGEIDTAISNLKGPSEYIFLDDIAAFIKKLQAAGADTTMSAH